MCVTIPAYFKNSYAEVEQSMNALQTGEAYIGCRSAGGRAVFAVEYGEKNSYRRTANYSSAQGAGAIECYADKQRPCVMIIGGVHGAEFEGIAAVLNFISLLETEKTRRGEKHDALLALARRCHLIFVPCANPDGRSRVPFEGVAGLCHETFRYYDQGAWSDGSLCGYPDCKRVHPMRGTSFLGGYFNDNGINLMHDNFFAPMAQETAFLLQTAEKYAPDVVLNLHGAADMGNGIYVADGMPRRDRERALAYETRLEKAFTERGYRWIHTGCFSDDYRGFNLTEAFYCVCGALSVTWECHQGVVKHKGDLVSENIYDEILSSHMLMFEETLETACALYEK